MIDEKLFSSGTCPVDALPLYLGHFQYTETCDKEVWLLYLRGPSHISKIKMKRVVTPYWSGIKGLLNLKLT